jgi:hypothetical protein
MINLVKTTAALIILLMSISISQVTAGEHMHSKKSADIMAMHHMRLMINHAVEMAAQGSNLIMIGQKDMAKGVDEISMKHGKIMIEDAKALMKEVMTGKTMMEMHKHEGSPDVSSEMAYTHRLGAAAMSYIDLVERMSSSQKHDN